MTRMDPSLARGYAHAFINAQPTQARIDTWVASPRSLLTLSTYGIYSNARPAKRGGQMKKIRKFLRPEFEVTTIWPDTMGNPYIEAMALGKASEASVLDVSYQDQTRFNELAVFLTTLLIGPAYDNPAQNMVGTYVTSNISHHAIRRMLERGISSPDDLKSSVTDILTRARFLGKACGDRGLMDFDTSVLMPIDGGAAVCTFSSVSPVATRQDPIDIASIRTVLSDCMLSPGQKEGFAGFNDLLQKKDTTAQDIAQWAHDNALPPRRVATAGQRATGALAGQRVVGALAGQRAVGAMAG